jgi:hypothetical protein
MIEQTTNDLIALRHQVIEARRQLAALEPLRQEHQAALQAVAADWYEQLQALATAALTVQETERQLKAALVAAYTPTLQDKTLLPGCSVRVTSKYVLTNDKAALQWAQRYGRFLKLDTTALLRYIANCVKGGESRLVNEGLAPFVVQTTNVTAVLASLMEEMANEQSHPQDASEATHDAP